MTITRNSVLSAIVGSSGYFPTCRLKQIGDELNITLYNSVGDVSRIFKADVNGMRERGIKTYYAICKYLSENPDIKLVSEKIKTPLRKTIIEVWWNRKN